MFLSYINLYATGVSCKLLILWDIILFLTATWICMRLKFVRKKLLFGVCDYIRINFRRMFLSYFDFYATGLLILLTGLFNFLLFVIFDYVYTNFLFFVTYINKCDSNLWVFYFDSFIDLHATRVRVN